MKAEIKPRINLEDRTRLETVIPLSTPYLVFLDPSDLCNARCSWCPTGSGEALKYKKPQLMDFDLYRKIIDDLCDMPEPIKTLRLYKDGEPLLNPWFADMVKYAKNARRFGQVDTTTNGILLNYKMQETIINAGLDKIFISVPTNYDVYYHAQIVSLYRISRGGCHVLVKIIGDTMNQDDKFTFADDFSNISDSLFIEHLSPCWPGYDVHGVNSEVGIYGQPIKEVQTCPYIFYSLAINSDGTVSLCFLDWKHTETLGDLKKESFKDIWNGKLLRDYRIMQLAGGRSLIRGCGVCQQLAYGAPDDIDQYAQDILRRF